MSRVPKTHPRIEAYADVDETNAAIGVARTRTDMPHEIDTPLAVIQNELFDVGADLSTPIVENPEHEPLRVTSAYIERLETWADEFNAPLGKLKSFVLPGGSQPAAALHQARTVARRAERAIWALLEAEPETTNALCAQYMNRLSDVLFILARASNHMLDLEDVLWKPGGERENG